MGDHMIPHILPLIDLLRKVHQKIKRDVVIEADFPKLHHLGFPAPSGIERAILDNQKNQVSQRELSCWDYSPHDVSVISLRSLSVIWSMAVSLCFSNSYPLSNSGIPPEERVYLREIINFKDRLHRHFFSLTEFTRHEP